MKDLKYFAENAKLRQDETLNLLTLFASLCKQMDRLNDKECSNPKYGPADEALFKEHQTKATEIAKKLKCGLHVNGDPRGPAIRLNRPDKKYNSWDGETWHVC